MVENILEVGEFVGDCPECDGELIVRENRINGNLFVGCTNFSTKSCKYTKNIKSCFIYRSRLVCNFIKNVLNVNISDIIYTWGEDEYLCLRIINNDELHNDDLEYINEIYDNKYYDHKRDNRSPLEMMQNVMLSWLMEDALYVYLKTNGYNISLNGSDKQRKFGVKPTNEPDLKLVLNNKDIYLEQIIDYGGYWKKYKNITLRDKKYSHLKSNNIFIFGIDLENECFILLNVLGKEVEFGVVENWNNKPATFIKINDNDFYSLEKLKNINEILKEKYAI